MRGVARIQTHAPPCRLKVRERLANGDGHADGEERGERHDTTRCAVGLGGCVAAQRLGLRVSPLEPSACFVHHNDRKRQPRRSPPVTRRAMPSSGIEGRALCERLHLRRFERQKREGKHLLHAQQPHHDGRQHAVEHRDAVHSRQVSRLEEQIRQQLHHTRFHTHIILTCPFSAPFLSSEVGSLKSPMAKTGWKTWVARGPPPVRPHRTCGWL